MRKMHLSLVAPDKWEVLGKLDAVLGFVEEQPELERIKWAYRRCLEHISQFPNATFFSCTPFLLSVCYPGVMSLMPQMRHYIATELPTGKTTTFFATRAGWRLGRNLFGRNLFFLA